MSGRTRVMVFGAGALGVVALLVYLVFGRPGVHVPDATYRDSALVEPSGVVWLPGRECLLVVSDELYVAEMTLEGKTIRRQPTGGRDLEDVVLLPGGEEALVVDERKPAVVRLRLRDLKLGKEVMLPAVPDTDPNRRYEGIACLQRDRRLLLVNERPGRLVEVEVDWDAGTARRVREAKVDTKTLSGLVVSPDLQEIVVLSRSKGLRLLEISGKPLGPWHRIDAERLEGLTLVPGKGLVLVDDERAGAIHVFEGIDTWSRLREFLLADAP